MSMNILPKQKVRKGFFAFFTTEEGKKLIYFAAGTTTIGLFLGNWIPHTFGLKKYKNFVQCYEGGMELPITDRINKRLEIALDKLNLNEYERKILKPFTVFGFDLFQAGSTKYRFGALLGIPINYSYNSVNDIKRSDVRFRNSVIDWNSESGKLLQQALVLEEDEQIFGLCKSILQVQTHSVLLNSIFPSVSFLMVYTLGRAFNIRMNLYARHMSVRLVLYSILGLFGFGSWCFMKDYNQVQYDAEIDKKLSSMGPEFVNAGLRYYDKLLTKNMALRQLLGDNTYTAKGNVNYFVRQKSLPLTIRKSFFEKKLQELQKDKSDELLTQ